MAYRFKELICDVKADVWDDWRQNFDKYVPIFIRECKAATHWSNWPEDSLNKFLSSDNDNPVSKIRTPQGKFSQDEIYAIKEHWDEIIPILKAIADNQNSLQLELYLQLERKICEYTNLKRWSAIHRMIAGIQPELLTTIVNQTHLKELCQNLESFTDIHHRFFGNYYEKSNQLMSLIKTETPDLNCYDIPTYAWQLHVILEDAKKQYDKMIEANKEIIELLRESGQIILTGAPGTGKTYKTAELALIICNAPEDSFYDREATMTEYHRLIEAKRIFFTTFHQSMDYEDFVEGYKPQWDEEAKVMKYELRPGIFRTACKEAEAHSNDNFVLIIDEINRGNISKIFGELITLLEFDKRLGAINATPATLTYSKEEFYVPKNIFIIGTMNTSDRSTGTIDYALRRRFQFYPIHAEDKVLDTIANDEVREESHKRFNLVMDYLKSESIDSDFTDLMVGHSYFLAESRDQLERKWKYSVIPLLEEYYKDGLTKISFDEWKNHRHD